MSRNFEELEFWRRLACLLIEAAGGQATFSPEVLYVSPRDEELIVERSEDFITREITLRVYRQPRQSAPGRPINWETVMSTVMANFQEDLARGLIKKVVMPGTAVPESGKAKPGDQWMLPPKKEEED